MSVKVRNDVIQMNLLVYGVRRIVTARHLLYVAMMNVYNPVLRHARVLKSAILLQESVRTGKLVVTTPIVLVNIHNAVAITFVLNVMRMVTAVAKDRNVIHALLYRMYV